MSYRHLTMDERHVIYRMQFLGRSAAESARCLGRPRSTIGRECQRNARRDGRYFAGEAQTWANSRRRAHLRRPKTGDRRLMTYVAQRLTDRGSPAPIAGRLSQHAPADLQGRSISHTTIYRWLGSDLERFRPFRPFLRIAHQSRRKPYGKPSRQGPIAGKRSIEERPTEANERRRRGDWEGDTMVGQGRTGFLRTCVDRTSRYLIAGKGDVCAAEPVAQTLQQSLRRLPPDKRHTLTLDNGREFARPTELADRLQVEVFFRHPYHAWERGTNENTNGLLRQYLPTGTDWSQVTPQRLRTCVRQINHRPRKGLGYQTPFEVFPSP